MPIQLTESNEGKTLAVHVTGKLLASDYEDFVPVFDRLVALHGKLDVLFEMTGFQGWTAGALWKDMKFASYHFSKIERLAIVGEKKWEEGRATIDKANIEADKIATQAQLEADKIKADAVAVAEKAKVDALKNQ